MAGDGHAFLALDFPALLRPTRACHNRTKHFQRVMQQQYGAVLARVAQKLHCRLDGQVRSGERLGGGCRAIRIKHGECTLQILDGECSAGLG